MTLRHLSLREMRIRHDEIRRKNIPTAAEVIEREILAEEMERARAIANAKDRHPASGVVELDPDVGVGLIIRLCEARLAELYPQWEAARAVEKVVLPSPTYSPAPGKTKVLFRGEELL